METGIMGTLAARRVDVREMLCAQALAVVAQALEPLARGQVLAVSFNAEDVKHDLLIWARDRGYRVDEIGATLLHIATR